MQQQDNNVYPSYSSRLFGKQESLEIAWYLGSQRFWVEIIPRSKPDVYWPKIIRLQGMRVDQIPSINDWQSPNAIRSWEDHVKLSYKFKWKILHNWEDRTRLIQFGFNPLPDYRLFAEELHEGFSGYDLVFYSEKEFLDYQNGIGVFGADRITGNRFYRIWCGLLVP